MFVILCALLLFGFLGYVLFSRSKFKNREKGTPFFFEQDQLVLNSLMPYPVKAADIDHVELVYNPKDLDRIVSNYVGIKVVKKDGKTRTVQFKVNKQKAADRPEVMASRLKEKGIRCVMPEQ